MNIQTLEEIIMSIEEDIFESSGGVEYFNITYTSNGYTVIVEFLGIMIWNNDDDERDYIDEEKDIKVPLEGWLRKRIMEEIEKIKKIRLI